MSTYLEQHGQREHWYETRQNEVTLGVIHTAEMVPDLEGADDAGERLANYAATTTRSVSWHDTTDRDSHIEMLPLSFTAWHARGYNSRSVGVEQALYAHSWPSLSASQREEFIGQTAHAVARWVREFDLPLRRLTRAQADAGMKGLVAHGTLDPDRRSDPGPEFPWDLLMLVTGDVLGVGVDQPAPAPERERQREVDLLQFGDAGKAVLDWQRHLKLWNPSALPTFGADGGFGGETRFWTRAFQKFAQIAVDGVVGPRTHGAMADFVSGRTSVEPASGYQLPDFDGTLMAQPPTHRFAQADEWQRALNAWRHGVVKVDGWYGPVTETWTRTFQQAAGVSEDGVVGPNTWRAMARLLG